MSENLLMNIIDYLKWRGDLSLKASPFNEVDNLIISQMAYTGFDEYFKLKDSYTISELSDLFFNDHTDEEIMASKSFVKLAPFVLREMANSIRFKDCLVHDFVSTIDEKTFEQFCCFQVDLSDHTTYVAFRGTDDTIVGWHEDFCMSFEIVPAQVAAKEYIQRLSPYRKYRIGGHSKGGALALYAGLNAPRKGKNIINIYSNDGPGLNRKYLSQDELDAYENIKGKIIKIVPEFDFFGVLFSKDYITKVVKSDAVMLLQHSAMSWLVEGTKFVETTLSEESKMIEVNYREFLDNANEEECKAFTEEMFDVLRDAGVDTVSEFIEGGLPLFVKTLYDISNMNKKSKAFAKSIFDAFIKGYGSGVSEKVKTVKDNLMESVIEKEKSLKERFSK
ncbi:MAG: DUF2974 domain-containing protein [Solobacterium sp.]|nr:DUF2974 domain-containing protein [Solobacterium sp.]MDY4792508.1 Mbeg1-like protein [Erysipelotrichaceae bacterium]MCI6877171.1 DUF2974 domain-containing protein [Solobacterium sp.]MCI7156360.1 DUF2974 domain-containing protein [Solobacterium sp.]MCI7446231.1 DUF2974 domain-containing protein [Solobacterium sp.]